MKKVVFSGIKPTGDLHLGNYIGAISQWVNLQKEDGLNIYCIVDLHAITDEQSPADLQKRTLDIAAAMIAFGIDPKKSIVFVQSHNRDHSALSWIINCNIGFGQMKRMTQFKDRFAKNKNISMGLFDYPALMAADILLYDTTHVPVGEDQKQHVELTRDVADRFNSRYGNTFVLPQTIIRDTGARVMSLADPHQKMSKSDKSQNGCVYIFESEDSIRKKVMSAVTDSEGVVRAGEDKSAITNLVHIYASLSGLAIQEIEQKYKNKGYKDFKSDLSDLIINKFAPVRKNFQEIRRSKQLIAYLKDGALAAQKISRDKLSEVYDKVGFVNIGQDV